jgi:cell division protein FtsB
LVLLEQRLPGQNGDVEALHKQIADQQKKIIELTESVKELEAYNLTLTTDLYNAVRYPTALALPTNQAHLQATASDQFKDNSD